MPVAFTSLNPRSKDPMTTELTWAIIGAGATIVSIVVAVIVGFPTLADWIVKIHKRPDLRVMAHVVNPALVADEYTYLRLDAAVVNDGNSTASKHNR